MSMFFLLQRIKTEKSPKIYTECIKFFHSGNLKQWRIQNPVEHLRWSFLRNN